MSYQEPLDGRDETGVTYLSDRDRDIFLAMLDDVNSKPNQALIDAAEWYKAYIASTDHTGRA